MCYIPVIKKASWPFGFPGPVIHLPLNIGKSDSTCGFALNALKNLFKNGISTSLKDKKSKF